MLLGIALQAEHDDTAAKAAAPVLALFDGQQLRTCAADPGHALAGYGGDIAWAAGGFAVGCPRANGVAVWQADGRWTGFSAAGSLRRRLSLYGGRSEHHSGPADGSRR